MNLLPASIEAYLLEADFSSTEVTILKKLLEVDALTLRQVASKTGKSTGVLDTAMDKLIKKNIVHKENINENAKYSLTSLDAVKDWMDADMKKRREELTRRHQNFETFLLTLSMDKTRPEMEHFHGMQGIEQVYNKVLREGQEMLQYVPVVCSAEDDPMRDFRVEYFRERRRRGLFSRVVAHNTPLGRRYQSRDPFEYRQTVLVPEDHYPFSFEKIITGDTVTCINHMEKRACFLRYPELAQMERSNFESIWRRETAPKAEEQKTTEETQKAPAETIIPMKVKTLSRLREFFLSRESLVSMGVLSVVAAVITFGLYQYTLKLNIQRIKERVTSVAATGVYQFNTQELSALQKKQDWQKPEWPIVVQKLKNIRDNNDGVMFTYIVRKISDDTMTFVADADSINPFANTDSDPSNDVNVNDNGEHAVGLESTSADTLSWPGQIYEDIPKQAFDAYRGKTSSDIYTDQWGTYITGYAPIFDGQGNAIAVFAADMKITQLEKMNAQTFAPILYFLGFFALFIFIRLAAFNRSLFTEIWQVFQIKQVLIACIILCIFAFAITFGIYKYTSALNLRRISDKVTSVAATGVYQFTTEEINALRAAEDWRKPEWAQVVNKLKKIRENNKDITFAYIIRKGEGDMMEFVADSHSINPHANTDTDASNDIDADKNGIIEPVNGDKLQWPGQMYTSAPASALDAYSDVTASEIYEDSWGRYISGYAPIQDGSGSTIAVLAIDMKASELQKMNSQTFVPLLYFFGIFLLFIFARLVIFNRSLFREMWDVFQLKQTLIVLALCAEIAFFVTLGLYQYMQRQTIHEVGNRLMSIVATSASQFNADDINKIRWAKDMKTEIYQRIFNQLNKIQDANTDVTYVYIFRPYDGKNLFEWVADTYANYYLPTYGPDVNGDGKINEADENIAPGEMFWLENETARILSNLKKPGYDKYLYTDQWGTWISGYAPIKDKNGNIEGILSADIGVSQINEALKLRFVPWLWFTGGFAVLVLLYLLINKQAK